MKKIILIILTFFITGHLSAQVMVFKTYKDYVNKKGTAYDDFDKAKSNVGGRFLTFYFIKNGEKVEVSMDDMWGFTYKDKLHRILEKGGNNNVATLLSQGKIFYFETGMDHLLRDKKGKEEDKTPEINLAPAYSLTLDGEVCRGFYSYNKKYVMPEQEQFWKSHPEHAGLFKCINGNLKLFEVRKCVYDYNK